MHGPSPRSQVPTYRRAVLVLSALAMLVTACGGNSKDEAGNNPAGEEREQGVESGLEDAGEPKRGGKVVYGLEAETNGGYCLAEGQLAIAGIQVARTIYDTLTVPNEDGDYVPFAAESVEPNDTYDEWTITPRKGVKFHDGTELTAEVVKNNLDAYRGQYEGRAPLLFLFVLQNIDTVEVEGESVKVTTKVPWVAFDAYLYSSGRMGMMAQSQLDDAETCDRQLVGTGPFKFEEWNVDEKLSATRNEEYWLEAPDGQPYPYLDEIEYRPISEAQQRVNSLETGDIQAMHTSGAEEILNLRDLQEAGTVNLLESNRFGEVSYTMLNSSQPPLDDKRVRMALAQGIDREEINAAVNKDLPTLAAGPFAPGNVGYLEDSGFPEFDIEAAKAAITEYEAEKGPVEITLSSTPDPGVVQLAELVQGMAKEIGVDVQLKQVDQATLISEAIAGSFQASLWRNHPGGDPDTQYVWWQSESPVNFGKIKDPEIDRLLEEGRSEPDPAKRKEIYESLNEQFAKEVWNLWAWYTPWAIGTTSDVHGMYGPDLPDGSKPFPGLAAGHSVAGMWSDSGS